MLYQVKVTQQGMFVASHIIEAGNALAAISLVEKNYGEPVAVEFDSIEDEHSRNRTVMTVNNWHGYMFIARVLKP